MVPSCQLISFIVAAGDYQEKPTEETVQVVSPNNQDISLLSGHIEPSQPDPRNVTEAEPIEGEDSTKFSDGIDPLDKFLSSPPRDKCSEELQVIYLLLVQLFSQCYHILRVI